LNVVADTERGRKRWTSNSTPSDRPPNRSNRRSQGGDIPAQPRQQDSGWKQREITATNNRDRDLRPLHPSWEAKRKLSEKQSAAIVPTTGKKIKFS